MNLDRELFIPTSQIMLLLHCNRQYVSKLARQKGWRFEWYEVGKVRGKKYNAADVQKEIERRKLRNLSIVQGDGKEE